MKKEIKHRDKLNGLVIETLSKKFGLSKMFIRQSINGERTSPTAKTLIEEYGKLTKDLKQVLS